MISTVSPKFIRKFERLGYQPDDTVLNPDGYRSFKVPLNQVSFRRPKKKLTEKEIAARIRSLQKARVVAPG